MARSDLDLKQQSCVEVSENWSEFQQSMADCKEHQLYCQQQLDDVEMAGVSLDARCQRYRVSL